MGPVGLIAPPVLSESGFRPKDGRLSPAEPVRKLLSARARACNAMGKTETTKKKKGGKRRGGAEFMFLARHFWSNEGVSSLALAVPPLAYSECNGQIYWHKYYQGMKQSTPQKKLELSN